MLAQCNDSNSNSNSHSNSNELSEFKNLVIKSTPGSTTISEKTRVLNETVTRQVEEYIDNETGKVEFRTIECVEKLLEHEVMINKVSLFVI